VHSSDTVERGEQTQAGAYPPGAETDSETHDSEDHVHLPPPSIWPITLAGGIALAGVGLVTTWPVSALGGLIMLIGLVNWVQELRHEPH
jgi:hypothetical protein